MSLAEIKRKLRQHIKERGISESALSEAAGLGGNFITGLFHNPDRDPGIAKLQKVCEVLDIPLAALLSEDVLYQDGSVLVPELDIKASAGHGSINGEEVVVGTWAVPRSYIESRKIYKP